MMTSVEKLIQTMTRPKRNREERVNMRKIEKNIAEVKDLLENLKEQYLMPEELARKEVPKVPAVKKGKKG